MIVLGSIATQIRALGHEIANLSKDYHVPIYGKGNVIQLIGIFVEKKIESLDMCSLAINIIIIVTVDHCEQAARSSAVQSKSR
ncbi:hypothetical protein TNIN_184711 [Trichonephila inaurata madagascariensis]|uniref:Uncharacterized protein n=1 Tax=Trichonephila inaurata madagascariensis TaxID=2747483 RepID=A0A8X6MH29_9ARAC|nr:hypothetical protein TNIN_184711 [Trichonephila inaurata madagascariensis]